MSTPYIISANTFASGTSSVTLTAGQVNGVASGAQGSAANDVIYIAVNNTATAGAVTVSSITDSKGNTYERVNSDLTQINTEQWRSIGDTAALVSGSSTITVTFSGTGGTKNVFVIGVPGVMPKHDNLALPATVNTAGALSLSITSGTFTEPNEVVFAVASQGANATEPAWSSGWTKIVSDRQSGNSWLSLAYQAVSATAPVTATATFPASLSGCLLMASFIIPSPSFPYLVGEAQAPSGGSTTLSVPVRGNVAAGDTILVGAAATAGFVSGVTDTAGNTYTQVPGSPVGAVGSKLYTFAAYGADAITPTTNKNAGRVGAICDYRNYTFGYSATSASPCVFTLSATGFNQSLANRTQVQLSGGTPPGGFTNGTTYYVVNSSGLTFSLAATAGGAPIASTSTGSGAQTFFIVGTNTTYTASQTLDNNTGHVMALGPTGSQKFYNVAGSFPQSFTLQTGQDATNIVSSGCTIWMCVKPATDGSDLTALTNMVTWWIANATNVYGNVIKWVIWQEPQNTSNGLTATSYINAVKAYAPMLHSHGQKVIYDASGHASSEWTSWYPGNSYIDEIAADYYGSTWASQTSGGTTNLDPLSALHNLADNNGKPFGLGEIGQAVWNSGSSLSNTLFPQYIAYITNLMAGRISQGLTNSDVMWYNGYQGADGNTIIPNDWRVPYITTLWNELTSAPASISVSYSTNTSIQAAVVVGDNNVSTAGSDIVAGTSGTGTTASVATGALGQAEEHIIAFALDGSGGGIATWGDNLYDFGPDSLAGGSIGLKAAFKVVNSTASDTPSATFASSAWSISAVTNKVLVPVIQAAPPELFVGQAFSFAFTAVGGVGALTWSETGTLPTGLSLSAAGVLSGTATSAGTYPVTIAATDSLGLQGTLAVTITVLGTGGPGGAPAVSMPTNILSAADCDSETATGYTWAAFANANAPARSNAISIAGNYCTSWTVPAAGQTQIATGFYPVTGSLPYVCSIFLLSGVSQICNIGIGWYDATGTLIDVVDQSSQYGSVPGTWTPLSYGTVAPAGATQAKLVVTVAGASAGDTYSVELAFMTQASAQVLIDWNNPAFNGSSAAGSMFMDVTPWVRFDLGLSYTRGRQDSISAIQAASGNVVLQNDNGEFTRYGTQAIPVIIGGAVSLQRRCQFNLADETGQWWTRFDGAISEIDYTYDQTGNTSTANITLTDVLANLSRQDPMFCWTKEQVIANGPLYHWTLDDPGNTGGTGPAGVGLYGTAAETSGNNGPPMRLLNSDSSKTATIRWQDTTGGVETLAGAASANKPDGSEFWAPGSNQPTSQIRGLDAQTVGAYTTSLSSVYLTPKLTAQTAQNMFVGNLGYMLQAELPSPIAPTQTGSDYSVECWFTMDPAVGTNLTPNYGPYIPLALGTSRSFTNLLAGLFLNAGALKFEAASYSQPPSFYGLNWPALHITPSATASVSTTMTPDTVQIPHQLVLVLTGDPTTPTVTLWLDGVSIGTFNLPQGQTYDTVCVGGAYGGGGAFYGNVSCVSVYGYALSPQQIVTDCQFGQYGLWETTSDDALTHLAQFAAVPSFWNNVQAQHNGLTMMEYIDITGSNALAAMHLVEQAEQGLLFVNAEGQLTFHTRDWRMGYGAPDLYLPPGTFDADLQYRMIDLQMCNEMGVAGPSTTGAKNILATLQSGTGTVTQSPNAVASAVVQAGYINQASQGAYGVYTPNPVSSPISLPLIAWSRAYSQLGIPSLSYWPDPNLIDVAAWNANSRADPALIPARLTIDLLTLDPNSGLGISSFYALDIDNMVAPNGTLPVSLPGTSAPLEWFIEGVTETIGQQVRTLQFYTSAAMNQRAWIPGDPVYGVLGSTTRIGISQSDLSTPQADGKDVSHDAGPPYWPPTFDAVAMNNPDGQRNGFVGANDMRGLSENMKLVLKPPMCVVSALQATQSFTNGALSNPVLNWDTVHVDTRGGMGLYPGYPQWYVVTVPGWYEIDVSVPWSLTSTGLAGYTGQAWIVVALGAAQALGSNLGTPLTVNQYVAPVGGAVRFNDQNMNPICNATTRMYLGLGDMVAVACEQNYTAARGTSTGPVGASMSIVFTGLGTADDRTELNSSIASGGTVTVPPIGAPGTNVYTNLHTYSYQGSTGVRPNARRNTDQDAYQGTKGGNMTSEGSQVAQVVFNTSQIQADLTSKTVKSVTLKCTNDITWYSSGSTLMLGYTTVVPGGTTFKIKASSTTANVMQQFFKPGRTITFTIPNTLFQKFLTGGATAFVLGNDKTTNLNYYGAWLGGPGNWVLTVNYK